MLLMHLSPTLTRIVAVVNTSSKIIDVRSKKSNFRTSISFSALTVASYYNLPYWSSQILFLSTHSQNTLYVKPRFRPITKTSCILIAKGCNYILQQRDISSATFCNKNQLVPMEYLNGLTILNCKIHYFLTEPASRQLHKMWYLNFA